MIAAGGKPTLKPVATAPRLLRNLPIICGSLGLAIGSLVLLGWGLQLDFLIRVLPGFAGMNPATAVAVMCCSFALLLPRSSIGLARGAGLVVIAIAGWKLAQLIGGYLFGVDQILFSVPVEEVQGVSPNRMAPSTAVALLLLGWSIISDTVESERAQLGTQIAAGGAAAVSLFNLIGYVLGIAPLYGVQYFISMALHTALSILILAIGGLSKRPTAMIEILWDRGPAGTLARMVLPLSVFVPVAVGLARIAGQNAGFYGIEVGVALLVAGNAFALFALLTASVIALYQSDLTRQKREAAVALSEKQYRLAENVACVGHWRMDASPRNVLWSDEMFNIAGLAKEQGVPGQAVILELYHPDDRLEARTRFIQAFKTGAGWNTTMRLVRPNGELRSVISYAMCEQQANGRVTAVFGVFADVTKLAKAMQEQVLAQERLQSAQAQLIHLSRVNAMGAMASTLAHELSQPLTAIQNYAAGSERVLELGGNSSELSMPLAEISKLSARAGEIIRRLREMTRKGEITKNQFIPDSVIIEAGALASVGACEGVQLHYDFRDGLPVLGDPIQIQQVLINLIRNACDAVADAIDQNVRVVSRIAGDITVISVEDRGPGIPPNDLNNLFEAFFSNKDDGMGLGLSISRTIIEAHGGKIWAENRPEGGARFSFTLPLAGPSTVITQVPQ